MKRKTQKRDSSANQEPAIIGSPDTDVESFGPWLKQQREVREIDQREVADASKISVRYIEALETNRFDVLPAGVFTKGFLRQYAIYVGLDPEEVVNYYLAALQAQKDQQEPDPDEKVRPRSPSGANARWLLVAVVVGAVLISLVWLLFRMSGTNGFAAKGPDESSLNSPGEAPASQPAVGSPELGLPPSEAGRSPADRSPADRSPADRSPADRSPADRSPAATSLVKPESIDNDELAAPLAQAPAVLPESEVLQASESTAPVEASSTAPVEDASSSPLTVVVDFSGDCWVEATLDQGRRLAEMRVQGESLRLEADSIIDIKFGNAQAVEVQVNGMPFAVEPVRGSSVLNLQIDLQTVAALRAQNGETGSQPQ